LLAGLGLAMLTLSGCNSQASTSRATTAPAAVPAGFSAAKRQWVLGSNALSYETSKFLRGAASDLSGALANAGTHVATYRKAISELRQLASLPETSESARQQSEARRDLAALNSFFGTKGLYQ
jgi:hypothetical protein